MSLSRFLACTILLILSVHLAQANDISPFKQSWVAKALYWQRQIDLDAPLNQATFLGTHNSYNSKSYTIPFVRYIDPNQNLSIYDQLEMGIRSLEFDAHWYLGAHGQREILLCHGQSNHLGCSAFDRPFREGLQELRDWLRANPGEIILLYIERHLDGHEPGLTAELEKYVGEFIYRPRLWSSQPNACLALPTSLLTKRDILKAGKQLIIVVKGCGGLELPPLEKRTHYNLNWNDYVFTGIGPIQDAPFDFLDSSLDNRFSSYPECGRKTIFQKDFNHTSLWRIFEDRTVLSNIFEKEPKIFSNEMRELMHCGINWPALDMLVVNDDRLKSAVWSWAPNYPMIQEGRCAVYKKGLGVKNIFCAISVVGYACHKTQSNQWRVINWVGHFSDGERACQNGLGSEWHFSVPINAEQMYLLTQAMEKKGMDEIALNYMMDKDQHWVAHKENIE